MLSPGSILESALYCSDLDAAQSFYETVLNLPLISRLGQRHAFFRLERGVLLLFNPDETCQPTQNTALPVPPHGAHGPGHLCFAATRIQIEAWRDRLTTHRIPIEAEFDWPGGARSLYFRDPAGNSLEFAEPRLWGLDTAP
ncbi:VOC family protein [Thalassobius sp. S69A]|uniref:VOC family protein n=1 Tax=unclassified Thalassovita TaxID=2619711 RepID=UPI003C7EC27A